METSVLPSRETPAAKAIRLFGAKRIAHRCDLTTNAVYKWPTRPGGLIPSRHLGGVMSLAREDGAALTERDLIAAVAA